MGKNEEYYLKTKDPEFSKSYIIIERILIKKYIELGYLPKFDVDFYYPPPKNNK